MPDPDEIDNSGGLEKVEDTEDERKVIFAEILGEDVDSPKVQRILTLFEAHEGPLPHPKHFREYADILGDEGNRIMTMAENEAEHRHEINRYNMKMHGEVTDADIVRASRGQWMFYSIMLTFVLGGVAGLFLDKPLAGYSSLGAAFIAALVNIFGAKFSEWNPFDGKTTSDRNNVENDS